MRSSGRVRETATPRSPVSCSGLHLPLGLTPPDPPHPRPHLGQPPSAACGGLSLRRLRHGVAVCLGSFACGFMVTSGRLNATASSNTGTQMPLGVAAGLISSRSPWPARLGGDRCSARSVPPYPTPPRPGLGPLPHSAAQVCVLQGARPRGVRGAHPQPACAVAPVSVASVYFLGF